VEAARADLANVSDTSLNNALSGNTLASLTITSADINGGTIDGTTIGGTSPAAVTGTTITATGDVTIPDKIIHAGDTNTAIRFPAADTVTVETSGAERLRVTSAGLVGIGTASPGAILELNAGTNSDIRVNTSASGYLQLGQFSNGAFIGTSSTDATAGILRFGTGGTTRATIDSSGNVGFGLTSPSYKVHASGYLASTAQGTTSLFGSDSTGTFVGNTSATAPVYFWTNGAERARIDSSGNLLVATTAPDPISSNVGGISLGSDNIVRAMCSGGPAGVFGRKTNTGDIVRFYYNGPTQIGSISTDGTSTAYNTTSDYRLKENVHPMQDALAVVAQLNPVTYTWKADGSDGQGFIAHELQAVVPDCVTGEKDAVDAEGNPQYQGVDTSFLVATLVKAVQELKAEVDSLRAQLNP
jgi:hypothetical protein